MQENKPGPSCMTLIKPELEKGFQLVVPKLGFGLSKTKPIIGPELVNMCIIGPRSLHMSLESLDITLE